MTCMSSTIEYHLIPFIIKDALVNYKTKTNKILVNVSSLPFPFHILISIYPYINVVLVSNMHVGVIAALIYLNSRNSCFDLVSIYN